MRVLVVRSNQALAHLLHESLAKDGHKVDVINSGQELLKEVVHCRYDLVLLDRVLPDADGIDVCRMLRAWSAIKHILMLSEAPSSSERILCLKAGADDCLAKPFDVEELLARVRAFERRCGGTNCTVRVGPLVINRLDRYATIDGQVLDLTPREFDLVTYLANTSGRAVGRTELLRKVWDLKFDMGSNVVDAHVKKVREKLGAFSGMIQTERRVGYRLVAAAARTLSHSDLSPVTATSTGAHLAQTHV